MIRKHVLYAAILAGSCHLPTSFDELLGALSSSVIFHGISFAFTFLQIAAAQGESKTPGCGRNDNGWT